MDNKNKFNVEKLYSKINNNTHYIIFGLSTCIFCQKTIQLLESKNIKYKYYIIDDFYNLFFKTFINLANTYPNFDIDKTHKTVPVVFYKKNFIGGFTSLNEMIN
jgi:glutaredoxin